MPRIDTASIEGYAEMTAEQKIAALEGFEYADLSGEVDRYKNACTKANSEAAEWKRKYNEILTAEERKAQEEGQTDELIAQLQRQIAVGENTAKYIALGYSADLAKETAEAIADGKMDVVIANQQKHLAEYEAKIKSDLMRGGGKPVGGGGDDKPVTREDVKKMTPSERLKFYTEHPDEYKKLYGGN